MQDSHARNTCCHHACVSQKYNCINFRDRLCKTGDTHVHVSCMSAARGSLNPVESCLTSSSKSRVKTRVNSMLGNKHMWNMNVVCTRGKNTYKYLHKHLPHVGAYMHVRALWMTQKHKRHVMYTLINTLVWHTCFARACLTHMPSTHQTTSHTYMNHTHTRKLTSAAYKYSVLIWIYHRSLSMFHAFYEMGSMREGHRIYIFIYT